MRLAKITFALLLFAPILNGCSSSDPASDEFTAVEQEEGSETGDTSEFAENEDSTQQPVTQSPDLQATASASEPSDVLNTFLESLQKDEIRVAEHLLTDRARYETKKAQMEVRRVPAADYHIGLTRYATQKQKVAHVDSMWTDNAAGEKVSFDITWVLHRHQNSWRVAGMLTSPAPGEPKIFLDFENPIDMVAKVGAAESTESFDTSKVRQASFEEVTQ